MDLRRYTHSRIKNRDRTRDWAKDREGNSSSGSDSGSHHGLIYTVRDDNNDNDNDNDNHHHFLEGEEGEEEVFSPEDQMRFMGSHGGVRDCIAQIIGRAMQRGDYLDAERLVLTGLLGAASTSNSHSLETIIRVVSAIVVEHPELYVPARVDRICMQVCDPTSIANKIYRTTSYLGHNCTSL